MDFSFDIFQIYSRFCDIMSGAFGIEGEGCRTGDESQKVRLSRALAQLLEVVESKRISVLEEVYKLMSRLDLAADFSEFSRFYDFVFFISRENGQKSITVSRAVMAWRIVLAGRFRLLNQWCNFVEENQRHNISEDTWRQVLAFSRCVHENLEGYDPEGAWPVLIDDFVEHMYRIRGSGGLPNLICNCSSSEGLQYEDNQNGLKYVPGSKRKLFGNSPLEQETLEGHASFKNRPFYFVDKSINWGQNQFGRGDESPGTVKQANTFSGANKSPCAVEGCLSKGFAGLFSGRSCLQFDEDRRVSYT